MRGRPCSLFSAATPSQTLARVDDSSEEASNGTGY